MYAYEDIRSVHFEITSKCNAACPACPHTADDGGINPALPMTELSLDDARAIFPADFVARLDGLYLCGNYGDALAARDTLPVLEYFRAQNPRMWLALHTNGSGRGADWWRALARLGVRVYFGIDGLEDTNHLYRRRTEWTRVLDSVRAFRGAGGDAVWNFIVFRHNEHQVEDARALAAELGFSEFRVKRSPRFGPSETLDVRDRDGSVLYTLAPPAAEALRNPGADAERVRRRAGTYEQFLDGLEIQCKAADAREIYVSAEGLVFPCCHTAHLYTGGPRTVQLSALVDGLPGGRASLDARTRPLRDIIAGPLFHHALPSRWKLPVADGGLAVCARVCGQTPESPFAPEHRIV